MRMKLSVLLLMFSAGVVSIRAQEPKKAEPRPPIYDEQANASEQISAALKKAKRENQRVLLQYGGNWCGWCYKLHDVLATNPEISRTIRYEYLVVPIDVGRFDKNMELAAQYGAEIKQHGVPFLTVLDADGKVLVNQNTGDLEDGDHHDLGKVKDFLAKWVATPLDAELVMRDALAQAAKEDKRVLLHFGAPWCGWCHKLEDFLTKYEELFSRDYVDVKVDMDRMKNAEQIAEKYRQGAPGGIPWFVILDAEGKTLVDSNGPQGNIGYPVLEAEVAHFMQMLKTTARKLSAEQIDAIHDALEEAAQPLRARNRS